MQIVIHSAGLPFDGDTLKTQGLGGSESAAYYQARELARRGHAVTVYTSKEQKSGEGVTIDGVKYCYHGEVTQQSPLGKSFEHYARNTPHDVLIIQRHPHAFHGGFNAKVCIHQHHDLALHRLAPSILSGAWQVDAFTAVSDWHREQMLSVYGINPDYVKVIRNGVDPSLYEGARKNRFLERDTFRMIYQSRPERGLMHLLREGGIMEQLLGTPATLYVFGYDNTVPSMAHLYAELRDRASKLPNVVWMGSVPKPALADYQRDADLFIYPTTFEEVSCISVMEAMHAGLPVLTTDVGALPETLKGAAAEIIALRDGVVDVDRFVSRVKFYASEQGRRMLPKAAPKLTLPSWERVVDDLEALIDECFARRRGPTRDLHARRIARTAIERGDIHFLSRIDPLPKLSDSIKRELAEQYDFLRSDEAYAAHYAKHQGAYYDDHEASVIGEDVTHTTRFMGTRMHVGTAYTERKPGEPFVVLDYGCAHGHYTVPLAKEMTDAAFVGVDVSPRAVQAARKWFERDGVQNARAEDLEGFEFTPETYDAIIAGEVLEHVRDSRALIEKLRTCLKPGGRLVITVPAGRWEWSGTEAFRNGREHVEHFERKDIEELFAGHKTSILYAPAGTDPSGLPMGSWVVSVTFTEGAPLGTVDVTRKTDEYNPRQTISACLIAKDAASTLRQCVASFVDFVDEVRIFIDPATKDATYIAALDLATEFKYRDFVIKYGEKSALKDGFDAARNESIEGAWGDWILWVDADETIRNAANLHRLARPSMHNGYGFKQIHYSAQPAQVLTTDLPCRFFRNYQGVKFYGLVHEHPETELGKAVTFSMVRPEVEFLHAGYTDEATRRKRYRRNLPLVLKDVDKHPTRTLNRFLLLRDIAQGISFEREQMGGGVAQHHIEQARKGVEVFERLLDAHEKKQGNVPCRLLVDAVQYYSLCVEVLGGGFNAAYSNKVVKSEAPDLSSDIAFSGVFHSSGFYQRFVCALIQESTSKYENRYL